MPHFRGSIRRRRHQKRPKPQKSQGRHWAAVTHQLYATNAIGRVPHAYRAVEAASGDVFVCGVKDRGYDAKLVSLRKRWERVKGLD